MDVQVTDTGASQPAGQCCQVGVGLTTVHPGVPQPDRVLAPAVRAVGEVTGVIEAQGALSTEDRHHQGNRQRDQAPPNPPRSPAPPTRYVPPPESDPAPVSAPAPAPAPAPASPARRLIPTSPLPIAVHLSSHSPTPLPTSLPKLTPVARPHSCSYAPKCDVILDTGPAAARDLPHIRAGGACRGGWGGRGRVAGVAGDDDQGEVPVAAGRGEPVGSASVRGSGRTPRRTPLRTPSTTPRATPGTTPPEAPRPPTSSSRSSPPGRSRRPRGVRVSAPYP